MHIYIYGQWSFPRNKPLPFFFAEPLIRSLGDISGLRTSPNWRRNSNASATWHVSAAAKPARAASRRPRWPRRRSEISGDLRCWGWPEDVPWKYGENNEKMRKNQVKIVGNVGNIWEFQLHMDFFTVYPWKNWGFFRKMKHADSGENNTFCLFKFHETVGIHREHVVNLWGNM